VIRKAAAIFREDHAQSRSKNATMIQPDLVALRSCQRTAIGPTPNSGRHVAEASVADRDDDQASAQDGQPSDDDGEEASGNAIKATHDTPFGSKGMMRTN
jgi:hypothetical protein